MKIKIACIMFILLTAQGICFSQTDRPDVKKIRLTAAEQAWIKAHQTIRVESFDGFPPIGFMTKDGKFMGMNNDYVRLIAERTGLQIDYVFSKQTEKDLMIKTRELDVIYSYNVPERREYVNFTQPFFHINYVIISRLDSPFISNISALKEKKIAGVKGLKLIERLMKDYPEINTELTETALDALKAVSFSKADVYVGAQEIAFYLIQQHQLMNLKLSGVVYEQEPYMFAVRKDWPELGGIISKAVDSITQKEHDAIFQKWLPVRFDQHTVPSALIKWGLGIGVFFAAILGISLFWNRRLAKEVAERRHMSEALRDSQTSLLEAQTLAKIGSWHYDMTKDKLVWSKEMYRIFGRAPALGEPAWKQHREHIHPEEWERLDRVLKNSLENGVSYREEFRILHRNGTIVWADTIGSVRQDESGQIRKLSGTVQDITERKKMEKSLRESEEKYRNLVESINDVLYSADARGAITYISPSVENAAGYKPDEMIGKPVSNYIWDSDLPLLNERFARLMSGKPAEHAEYRMKKKDGNIFIARTFSRPIFKDNAVTGIQGIVTDITAQKQAEQQLKKSEEKYRTLVENMNDVLYLADLQGIITYISPSVENAAGYKPDEMIGSHVSDYFSDSDLPLLNERFTRLISGKRTANIEYRMKKKDGNIFIARISSQPIFKDNAITGIQGIITDITAQKQAEQRLREGEEKYRSLVENISEILYTSDNEGIIRYVSPTIEHILGFSPEEVMGTSFSEFIYSDDLPRASAQVALTLSGETGGGEYRIYHKSGKPCWVIASSRPIYKDNTVAGFQGILTDISAQKSAEQSLKLMLEKLQELEFIINKSHATAFLWRAAEGWPVEYVSDNIAQFGYTAEDFTSGRIAYRSVIHPEDQARVGSEVMFYAQEGKEEFTQEYRIIGKDGKIYWFDGRTWIRRDKNGNITHYQGLVLDISDRKIAEDRIRHLLAEQKVILDNAMVGIVFVKDRKFVRINKFTEKMFGYSMEDVAGKYTSVLYPSEESYEALGRKSYPLLTEGKVCKTEWLMMRKDRTSFWCWLVGVAINPKDIKDGVLWILQDIDKRREHEEELRHARDAAESATRAKSEFLANMSHEIRTPMNAIVNMTRLLLNTRLDEAQQDYAETAMASSEILLSLINDILDFSKIEAGKLELECTDFSLADTVESVVKILGPKTEEKGLWLTHSIQTYVHPYLKGDPARLRQILLNFVNNAVKFTEKGGIVIRVSSENLTDQDTTLKFEVTDTGIGIPKDRMEKLFKSFSQADASTTRRYGGTGLGLVISKELAELMGGNVGVKSEEGKGSTFWFTAVFGRSQVTGPRPQVTGYRAHETGIERYGDIQQPGTRDLQPARILLSEDNIFNQKVALAILKEYGFSADIANNGKEAVESLRKARYDLVLMDMQMPVTDGVEATRIIRNPDSGVLNPNVPIVAMTANATTEDRKKCADAGMNDYLSKPVNPESLLSVIRRFLSPGGRAQAAGRREQGAGRREQGDIRQPATSNPQAPPPNPHPPTCNLPPVSEIFNKQELMNRLGRDKSLFKAFIKDIPDSIAEEIQKLKTAANKKDAKKIVLYAHAVKGVCANFAAHRLSESAYRIECIGKQGRTDIADLLETLEDEYETLRALLSDMFPDIFTDSPSAGTEDSKTAVCGEVRPPELRCRLEKEMIPKCNKIGEMFYFNEAVAFAEELKHLADEYQADLLTDYSRKLYEAAAGFDIHKTEKLLNEFPEICRKSEN